MRVAVLGHTGMLGSMVYKVLKEDEDLEIIPIGRRGLDVKYVNHWGLKYAIQEADWIINCIGVIPQKPHTTKEMIEVNAIFPHILAEMPAKTIQIASDCVFSGKSGGYREDDKHDPLDVYGKTKSLGEVYQDNFYNIRCSIIGVGEPKSLLGWFLSQPNEVNGYANHFWNGVTTYHFARVCQGIIKNHFEPPTIQHFIPKDIVSKENLLGYIAKYFDREDINIKSVSVRPVDRTLDTVAPKTNKLLWKLAGYNESPTIEEMIKELAEYTKEDNNYLPLTFHRTMRGL